MFACSMCPFYSNVRDELIYHLLKRHRNAPNFIVHCSSDGCGASFKSYNSFRMHCIRNHCSDQLQKEITIFENDDLSEQDVETFDGDNESVHDYEEKISDAQYLLKLKAGHNLSNTAVDEIVLSTKSLLSDRLEKVKKSLREVIPIEVLNDENMENILHVTLFDGLDSEYQQEKFFRENLGYVKPVAVKLGTVNKQVKRGGRKLFVRCDIIGYVVPFMEALQQLLKMPEVRHCLEEDIENSSKMRDFYDGSYMEKSFFQNHPDALLFCLYFDDFEIANPIGSHKKKHKLSVFYWSLINISPEFRFRIHATQLLAIAKTSYLKKFGLKSILSDFINCMQNLVTGVELEIGPDIKTVFGALYCVLGDTLAAQLIGGFKEGVGLAEKPCRTCEITHLELSDSLHGSQFRLRDEQEYRDRCDLLDNLNKRQRNYWSRKYGITSTSVLLNVPVFDVTKCILHDPMHVLLEGIVKMEIQLMLSDFIEKCNFLTLNDLNVTIGNFEYTVDEALDKPHVLERRALDRKNVLPLTAIETKNFMTLLPFMIGEKIPEDNMKWQNFLRLVKITLLAISPVASAETVDSLHQIVYEHNSSFKNLYQDVDLTPKFHYLTHLADQIKLFGPGRNHWCMRLEAKHGLIKNKKWRNFKCIEKSVAFYHQRWMCLQQSGNLGLASECYLYSGDTVKEGASLKQEDVADEICQALENFGVHIPSEILSTLCVCIKGISYKTGSTLLLDVGDEPVFGFIDEILVNYFQKFFVCLKLNIKDFNMHINAFECVKTNKKAIIRINDLAYKFPQVSHYYLENEVDGLTLKNFKDGDVMKLLPNKLGPARKLTLLIDMLKAMAIQKSIDDDLGKSCVDGEASDTSTEHTCSVEKPIDKANTSQRDAATIAAQGIENQCVASSVSTIPKYSIGIQKLLDDGSILKEWDKFIEETAYYVLAIGQFKTKDMYADLGRLMFRKYPCIGFPSGKNPWAHFTKKLSQKIRNIRWKWNRRSMVTHEPVGNDEARRKKAPRKFVVLDEDTIEAESNMSEHESLMMMKTELEKPKQDQDKAMLLRLQRSTFKKRRQYLQSVEDGNIKAIVEKYPVLGVAEFIEREFSLLKHMSRVDNFAEKWNDMLSKLDAIFGIEKNDDSEDEVANEDHMILEVLQKIESTIRFKSSKKELDLITVTEAKNVNLKSKSKSPPRLIVTTSDNIISGCFIVGDSLEILAKPNIKDALNLLVMAYYVYDLSYPKCYQLLGFIQTYIFEDDAQFHRGTNYIKFEKQFIECYK